jgi:predicted metal-dependent HD superfamily phosphohydrolase
MTSKDDLIVETVEFVLGKASKRNKLIVLGKIMAAYNNAARGYHNALHIIEFIEESKKRGLSGRKDFMAAVLFHDIVYEPDRFVPEYRGPSNEEESALFCKTALYNCHVSGDVIQRACDLILMTQKHIAPKGDRDAALFIDMDMSVLGSASSRYETYARGVAKEYLQVFKPAEYIAGRTKFLKSQREKESIFLTPHYKPLNVPARENMAWEIENLPALVSP